MFSNSTSNPIDSADLVTTYASVFNWNVWGKALYNLINKEYCDVELSNNILTAKTNWLPPKFK